MDQERFEVWEVTDARERVAEDIRDAADDTSVGQRAREAFGTITDNPMLMLLGGLAIGCLIGMLLPISRFENDRIGPVADDLKGRAREAIKESIDAAAEASRT
jgi:hypothetical protein